VRGEDPIAMTKPIRCSVAAVVRRQGEDRFLAVRRPIDDDKLPGVWGLPAVTLRPGELPEDGLRRLGHEKLGVRLEPFRFVGIRASDRGAYELILMNIEATVVEGEPDVYAATTMATRYVDQKWARELGILTEAAEMGSLCCRILLEAAEREASDYQ
jgi:ADP-ribose pyrophosphatase YjhB (NUDIX family)